MCPGGGRLHRVGEGVRGAARREGEVPMQGDGPVGPAAHERCAAAGQHHGGLVGGGRVVPCGRALGAGGQGRGVWGQGARWGGQRVAAGQGIRGREKGGRTRAADFGARAVLIQIRDVVTLVKDSPLGTARMHWKGEVPPHPSCRPPSLCPATVSLAASAGFSGVCNRQ